MIDNNLNLFNKTKTLFLDMINTKKETCPFVPNSTKKPFPSNNIPHPFFERVTPESQGIDSAYLMEYVKELASSKQTSMQDIMILRNGKVIYETSFGYSISKNWKMTFSAAKSIISIAVGICVDKGILSVNDKVISFFPEKLQGFSGLTLKDLTVHDLLCMKSAVVFNEAACVSETDWVKGFLNSFVNGAVGKDFTYNSLNTYMLAAIITKVTGKSVSDFLNENLFSYMGITDYYWETCPLGVEKGGWGLYVWAEDLAKIGQLILNRGVWNGQRLLSEEWIIQATSLQAIAPSNFGNYNYGYQIWIGRKENIFLFNGALGQNVHGFFDNGILIVSHAVSNDTFQTSDYYSLSEKYFCKAFPDSIPENKNDLKLLEDLSEGLRFSAPKKTHNLLKVLANRKNPIPQLATVLFDNKYICEDINYSFGILPFSFQVTQNNFSKGFEGVYFENRNKIFHMIFKEGEEYDLRIGFEKIERSLLSVNGENFAVDCIGKVGTDEDDNIVLTIDMIYSETPFVRKIKFRFFKDDGYSSARIENTECPSKKIVYKIFDDYAPKIIDTIHFLKPLIAKADKAYLDYRLDTLFEPVVMIHKQ